MASSSGDAALAADIATLHRALSVSAARPVGPPADARPPAGPTSFWKKSLNAISHIGRRRLDCHFTLHVHSIANLPASLNGAALFVSWSRSRNSSSAAPAVTRAVTVSNGSADVDQGLSISSPVYYSRAGRGAAKYEPRVFTVVVTAMLNVGGGKVKEIEIGRHDSDLTRLLPLNVGQIEGDEGRGKWSTSFRLLSGKEKGVTVSVTYGFEVLGAERKDAGTIKGRIERRASLPVERVVGLGMGMERSRVRLVDDVRVLHEVPRSGNAEEEEEDVDALKSLTLREESCRDKEVEGAESPEAKHCTSEEVVRNSLVEEEKVEIRAPEMPRDRSGEQETAEIGMPEADAALRIDEMIRGLSKGDNADCITVIDQGVEVVPKVDGEEDKTAGSSSLLVCKEEKVGESMRKELDKLNSILQSLSSDELEDEIGSPAPGETSGILMSYADMKSSYRLASMNQRSHSFHVNMETVADEFLDMLGIEHSPFGPSSGSEPDSPRERLLREFEKETLAAGRGCLDLDFGDDMQEGSCSELPIAIDTSEDFDLNAFAMEAESEYLKSMGYTGTMIEDAETGALMREWGIDEKSLRDSTHGSRSGFGSPIDMPPEEPLELPPLCEGLGPFVQTKDGGFLRSMNPALFKNTKNGGHLVMQASRPVVMPAEMGSGVMEILQCLAADGLEKLSMQAKKLMPLEDVTGRMMQECAWNAGAALESSERSSIRMNNCREARSRSKKNARGAEELSFTDGEDYMEYVSLEDLAPLAMDKIEALSIEGLRIQSGLSDEAAPSNINVRSVNERKEPNNSWSVGLEGATGLQLLDVKDGGGDVDGLMGLSLTLDEWMKLDSGIIDEENQCSERTSKVLAAHHAKSMDLASENWKGDKRGKKSGKKCGLLCNNFTVALMVQLRDPFRDYEPVGTPMLALIQVERIFVPPKPRFYMNVSEKGNSEQDEDAAEPSTENPLVAAVVAEKVEEQEPVVQFSIKDVDIAGIKNDSEKRKLWGNAAQQQSGSRWLLAAGMGKSSSKQPFAGRSKAVAAAQPAAAAQQQGDDTLWSISSRGRSGAGGSKWKEIQALAPHKRNPNIRLR